MSRRWYYELIWALSVSVLDWGEDRLSLGEKGCLVPIVPTRRRFFFFRTSRTLENEGIVFLRKIGDPLSSNGGTRWRSWLRHCAKSRKVAGSIPDGVIGIFHWHNPSCCTMAMGSSQPLTEMSTRNISWEERRLVRRADNLTTFVCRLYWNLGAWTSWNPQGLSRPVMGLLYLLSSNDASHPTGTESSTTPPWKPQ